MTTSGFGSLDGVKLIEKTENSVTLEFKVPDTSPYYDGHFPEFPILPAVAQMELVVRFAYQHLNTDIDIPEIKRIKFSNFVRPNKLYILLIEKDEKTLSFKVSSRDRKVIYSSGTLVITRKA